MTKSSGSLFRGHAQSAREIQSMKFHLKVAQISQLSLAEQWLAKLRNDVELISAEMEAMFARLGYDGRLLLIEPTVPDDAKTLPRYDEYGLDFEVRFRDSDELATLTSGRQSGGERVVSIAIFLLALQTRSDVPFRVVDELNQV